VTVQSRTANAQNVASATANAEAVAVDAAVAEAIEMIAAKAAATATTRASALANATITKPVPRAKMVAIAVVVIATSVLDNVASAAITPKLTKSPTLKM
jgi:hypothetical protein